MKRHGHLLKGWMHGFGATHRKSLGLRAVRVLLMGRRERWITFALFFSYLTSAVSQPSRAELEAAIDIWNTTYAYVAECRVVEEGLVQTENDRLWLTSEMVDPANVWMLSGELTQPRSLQLRKASDFPELVQSNEYNAYVNRVRDFVNQATRWYRLEWNSGDHCIQTLVVANDEHCLYNSILSEAYYISERLNSNGRICLHAEARNFFGYGWKVGEVIVGITPICGS